MDRTAAKGAGLRGTAVVAACCVTAAVVMMLAGCGSEVATAGQSADSAAAVKSSAPPSEAGAVNAAAAGTGPGPAPTSSAGPDSPAATPVPVGTAADAPVSRPPAAVGGSESYVDPQTQVQVVKYLSTHPEDHACAANVPPGTSGQLVLIAKLDTAPPYPSLLALYAQTICGPDLPDGETQVDDPLMQTLQLSPDTTFELDGSQPGVVVWATYAQFARVLEDRSGFGPFGWSSPYFVVEFDAAGEVSEVVATMPPS